eukprot:5985623-Amphidinium_carterae.1
MPGGASVTRLGDMNANAEPLATFCKSERSERCTQRRCIARRGRAPTQTSSRNLFENQQRAICPTLDALNSEWIKLNVMKHSF